MCRATFHDFTKNTENNGENVRGSQLRRHYCDELDSRKIEIKNLFFPNYKLKREIDKRSCLFNFWVLISWRLSIHDEHPTLTQLCTIFFARKTRIAHRTPNLFSSIWLFLRQETLKINIDHHHNAY